MKKVVSMITGIAVVGVSLLSGTACAKPLKGGKEALKILLAQDHFDETEINTELNVWESASQEQVVLADLPVYNGTLDARAETDEQGFTNAGEYYEWSKFPAHSETYGYYEPHMESILLEAEDVAEMLGKFKSRVQITDKWVTSVNHEYDYLMQVKEDGEYLFTRDKDDDVVSFEVARRYTGADAKNIVESYSYTEAEVEGKPGTLQSYSKFIEGEYYEDSFEASNGHRTYVVIDNSRGYWTFRSMSTFDGREFSFDTCVIKDGIGYNAFMQVSGEEKPKATWFSVFDPASGREYLQLSQWWNNWAVNLHFSAIESGLTSVRAYGSELMEQAYRGRDGYEYEHGAPLTLVTKNATLQAGDIRDDVKCNNTIVRFEPYEEYYYGNIELSVQTDGYEGIDVCVSKLDTYLSNLGITTYYDEQTIIDGVELAMILEEEYGNVYSWNGYPLDSLANANNARGVLLQTFEDGKANYAKVKDNESTSGKYRLDRGVDFAEFTAFDGGQTSYKDGKVTVTGLTASVEDFNLFETGVSYKAELGLTLVDDEGEFSSVHSVGLDGGTGASVTYAEDMETLTVGTQGEFTIPKNLAEGKYMLVAYVSTADGLRVSEMQAVACYQVTAGEVQSAAMDVQVKASGENLLVEYAVKLSVTVTAEVGKAYTGEEMERLLKGKAVAIGYPKSGEKLTTDTGAEVDKAETLGAGRYRLKAYVSTVDGIAEAYIYCEITE
ncbi:MAG: hypothetical protein IJ996_00195 [Clostridia bacterium]|nr:hypothetical protein [Clostridia bacterium]